MKSKKKKVYYIDQLLKKPQKDKKNKSTFPTTLYKPNFIHQIDLLFLPYDEYNKERYSQISTDHGGDSCWTPRRDKICQVPAKLQAIVV